MQEFQQNSRHFSFEEMKDVITEGILTKVEMLSVKVTLNFC